MLAAWSLLLGCSGSDGRILVREPLAHQAWGIRLEPPIPLPLPSANGWVEVWIGGPTGPTPSVGAAGGPSLAYAPGTVADRVELRDGRGGPRVIDVRGTSLDEDGRRWHHVYRAVSSDPERPLVGAEWPADDPDATRQAIDALLAELAAQGVTRTDAIAETLDCEGCHRLDRPPNTRPREHGLVSRGTDGAGFFTPSTLLREHGPAELYGTLPEAASVTWTCGEPVPHGTRICPDGSLAVGRFDPTTDDPHARAVAESRAALSAWVRP